MKNTRKAQRAASALVANYIHELSERHGAGPRPAHTDGGRAEKSPAPRGSSRLAPRTATG